MRLREYIPTDAESLAAIYRDAARTLGRQGYTTGQTRIWARHPEDLDKFRIALSHGLTVCALVSDSPVAFGQMDSADHVAYLYCHSAHARRGYASAILARLEGYASSHRVTIVRVEASCVARPFFEHAGYRVVEEEHPVRHDMEFIRFKIEKKLTKQAPHGTAYRCP